MVGEGFFGADPRKSFLVENLRDRLLPVDRSCVAGGEVTECSWGVGSGWLSFNMRTSGSISSRRRLFSSMTRLRSSRRWRSSDSAVCMRSSRAWTTRMTLAKSSCVGGASCADVSAAVGVVLDEHGGAREVGGEKRRQRLTQRNVVIRVHGHILPYLDVVDSLEDGEAVADAADAQLLQLRVLQGG